MEKYLYQIILKLRRDHNVIALIPLKYNFKIKNVKIYHYFSSQNWGFDSLTTLISLLFVFPIIVLKERPKIVSAFIPSFGSAICFSLARLFRIKTVMNLRGTADKDLLFFQLVENYAFLLSNAIVMNAKELRDKYYQKLKYAKQAYLGKKSYYIPNAIDSGFWKPNLQTPKKIYDLVFVGNITNPVRVAKKDIKNLLEALEYIEKKYHRALKLSYIGKYSKQAVIDVVGRFDEKYFKWQGSIVDKIVLKEEVQKAALFVLSSNVEGMPNSLMEAMALGMPCVSTNVGAVNRLIDDNVSGYIVPIKNSTALAEKIWTLLNDTELQAIFGQNARKKMFSLYGWRKNVALVEKCYKKVLDD